jgi:ketosteroid isomerase-like protein
VSAEENTRLVQTAYEAFGRGDMAAFAEVMADDIEWVDPGDPDDDPNAGTFRGKEAVLGWFGGLASTLDYTTFEPREFIAQNDKVVSLVYSEATVRTPAARLSILRHTCGRSGMESSPDSRAITTPQRRLPPTAWSSHARGTGESYVACASVQE